MKMGRHDCNGARVLGSDSMGPSLQLGWRCIGLGLCRTILGNQRFPPFSSWGSWVAKGTDKVDKMGIAQGTLLVNTIDENKLAISVKTGEVLPATYQWPKEWTYLASDKEGQVLRSGDAFREKVPELMEVEVKDTYCAADQVKIMQEEGKVVGSLHRCERARVCRAQKRHRVSLLGQL